MGALSPELRTRLAKWKGERDEQVQQGAGMAGLGEQDEESVWVFVHSRADPAILADAGLTPGSSDGRIVTGKIALAKVEAFAQRGDVESVNLGSSVRPVIDRSMTEAGVDRVRSKSPPYCSSSGARPYTGKGVLVGVIDDSIYERHPSFLKGNPKLPKSRIVGIWDQRDVKHQGDPPSPPPFAYGAFWDEKALNDLLGAGVSGWNRIGSGSTIGHGSHVTGIAAANGDFMDGLVLPHTLVGAAPEADIVFCNAAGIDSAGVAAADALRFIFKFAEERHQACVVNMSFGSMEGARDGSSDLERVIDSVLNDPAGEPRPGRAVVVAAGNEAKSERHSRKQMAANGQLRFELTVADTTYPNGSKSLPKVAGDKILGTDQIYVWYLAGADLEIRVTPPSGRPDPTGWTKLGDIQVGQSVAVSSGPATPPNGKNYIVITIWAPIPYGHWIIELRERNGVETPVDIWVDSINDAYTTPRFIGSDVIVANTLTCPSTARSAIAVGAYIGTPYKNETKGDICDFSSQGLDSIYGVSASNVRPHIVAPGRLIVSANNSSFADRKGEMNVMTERYGRAPLFHALMSGTSQAAPHVAGVIALMFEKNPRLTWVELKAILARSADKPQAALWSFPNGVWGYGKLNAAQAIAAVP